MPDLSWRYLRTTRLPGTGIPVTVNAAVYFNGTFETSATYYQRHILQPSSVSDVSGRPASACPRCSLRDFPPRVRTAPRHRPPKLRPRVQAAILNPPFVEVETHGAEPSKTQSMVAWQDEWRRPWRRRSFICFFDHPSFDHRMAFLRITTRPPDRISFLADHGRLI